MKVKRLTVKNVLSYRDRTDFIFDKSMNIIIGPNGGGKTNVQKIIAVVLGHYFIPHYNFPNSESETKIERFSPWSQKILESNLSKFSEDTSEQIIEIELLAEASDIRNIQSIGDNLDRYNEKLNLWESPFESYPPAAYVKQIESSHSFSYVIKNLCLEEPQKPTPEWAFAEYLKSFFIFMRFSGEDLLPKLSSPVFFFFSERNAARSITISSSHLTEQHHYQGYRSVYQAVIGDNTNLMQWGAQHFARLQRNARNLAAETRGAITTDYFEKEMDVKLLDKYLNHLGYDFGFSTNKEFTSYQFALMKGDNQISPEMFSSGEREIVHFLVAMIAFNTKDGLILVDEPELHLHPRWQQIFLNLFRELSIERNNQFIISTHSPVFVSPDTINDITRIHRKGNSGSSKISLREIDLPEKKNLVRMINSQNNERMFFADKVVLVEGISDRIVFSSLINRASARFLSYEAIEILEVGGKNNFSDYETLLDALSTDCFVIADRDYLMTVGNETSKIFFTQSDPKAADALLVGKKSIDRHSLIAELKAAIASGNMENLGRLVDYIGNRHVQFKNNLSQDEVTLFENDLNRLRKKRCNVLKFGEIEDYLPPGVSDLRGIVEMTANPNWINNIVDESKRAELATIVSSILGLSEDSASIFDRLVRRSEMNFPTTRV